MAGSGTVAETERPSRLIVIGASWGGVDALRRLVGGLAADIPAALLVVLHIGDRPSLLPGILGRAGALPVAHARQGDPIVPGRIYVAPPDHHLLVQGDTVSLSRGPKEHHSRPAIDPLFRSAALAAGPRVIGVVLTGMLDDGTPGLQAIKRCGGLAVIESPETSFCPEMPLSAQANVEIDHCVDLDALPRLLADLVAEPVAAMAVPPEDLIALQALSLNQGDPLRHLEKIGGLSGFTCPSCHGPLWRLHHAEPPQFACHTGHVFTARSLQHAVAERTDDSVWNALRAVQEHAMLLDFEANHAAARGQTADAVRLKAAAGLLKSQAGALRQLTEQLAGDADVVS